LCWTVNSAAWVPEGQDSSSNIFFHLISKRPELLSIIHIFGRFEAKDDAGKARHSTPHNNVSGCGSLVSYFTAILKQRIPGKVIHQFRSRQSTEPDSSYPVIPMKATADSGRKPSSLPAVRNGG